MKIAFFVGGMWIGGVTTYVLELGRYLQEAGHEIKVVACEEGQWWPRIEQAGLNSLLVKPSRWESTYTTARRLAGCFRAEQFDAVFLNDGLGVRPGMLSIHMLPDSIFAVPVLHNDLARVYDHAQINQMAWNAAVTVSPKINAVANALMPNKPKVQIPYGIPTPPDSILAQRRPWSLPLRLLFVGTLWQQQKGILLFPEILRQLQQWDIPVTLTLIGEGPDREALMQSAEKCGVAHLIDLKGALLPDAVYQAMQDHHVLLLPSHFEGLPLVSLEAQANGCVPVASNLTGIMDKAVEPGVSGFLAAVDHAGEFAQHIAALARDETIWKAVSNAGILRARTYFSVEVMAQQYQKLLAQLAAGQYPLANPRSASRRASMAPFSLSDYLPAPFQRRLERFSQRLRNLRRAAQ